MSRYSGGWPSYVPVAERRRKAAREIDKLRKRGHSIAPVTIEGRAIATTFWGKAWCTNLESYGDYESRLPRGRTYVFMMFAPLQGWRHVEVTDRHTALDYAQVLKQLSDTHFPAAKKIVLVQDNLSTHKPASLYEAFPAEEAGRLVERFEWHYTSKHGSWLDMAESKLGGRSSSLRVGPAAMQSYLRKPAHRLKGETASFRGRRNGPRSSTKSVDNPVGHSGHETAKPAERRRCPEVARKLCAGES